MIIGPAQHKLSIAPQPLMTVERLGLIGHRAPTGGAVPVCGFVERAGEITRGESAGIAAVL